MRQPNWDQYEASLLIEAYWKTKEKSANRALIVADLSALLRKRAGYPIDDAFRNENGISMRLYELEYLFSGENTGLKNTSDLFRKMVSMYKEDREGFNKILSEAKKMATSKAQNIRSQFCEWLGKKTHKIKPEDACRLLLIAENYCVKCHIIDSSLFETTDIAIVDKVVKTISNHTIFRLQNKKKFPAIVDAVNWYYSFILSFPKNEQSSQQNDANSKSDQSSTIDNVGTKDGQKNPSTSPVELNKAVEDIIKSEEGISIDDICKKLPDYNYNQIKSALAACHSVLVLSKYHHRDNIYDYQTMADIMLETISRQFLQYDNYTSALQLYNEVRPKLDDFFFYNNRFDSRQEIYDLAVHLFVQEKYKGNSFIFMSNIHIWKKKPDYPTDFRGLLIKYAREHDQRFSREEALLYFERIGSASPSATFSFTIFNTGSRTFLQYAENQFILAEALNISESFLLAVKTQIERLLEGEDYIPMGEIDDYFYTTLPLLPCSIRWSPLLLEDILRVYEVGFTTVEAGDNNDKKTEPAAIVRKNSRYKSFSDVVWNEVAKTYELPKEFTSWEFREFLLQKGFIHGWEKMWNVHKTVAGDIRFYWTNNNGTVTIN